MRIKCCESNKSTVPPKEYGERCLKYLDQKFVVGAAELQQLKPEQVQELVELEKQTSTAAKEQGEESGQGEVMAKEPEGSPLHGKAKKTPTAGSAGADVYHSTKL